MIVIMVIPILLLVALYKFLVPVKKKSIKSKHVVITGGSSGIGKAAAILAAKQGAHVTIIARNVKKLEEAVEEIKQACIKTEQIITMLSLDVSNYELVENSLLKIEESVGPIYMLINCAGLAICGRVEELSISDIKQLIDVNYLGTLYTIKAILPKFKQRSEGILVLTASQAALMGIYGLSVYSSVKFALRGLSESLHMEVKPYGITVTLSLPPDTDTPGYENENKNKPEETKFISESAGIFQPEVVAKKILDDALAGNFLSYIGFESFILTTLCVGMTPISSVFDVLLQMAILGPLRAIGCFYIRSFDSIIQKMHITKENEVKKST